MDDKERVRRIACLLDIVRTLSEELTEPRPKTIMSGYLDDDTLTESIIVLETYVETGN